jgi:ABC-2 type transport system ATP-binding protein
VILAENLSHQYGSRQALSNVNFEVKAGEIFGLLGPNGGGKSTLFRILSTMMTPTGGRAEVAGHDVARDPAAVRRCIGVVFQTQSLDKALTVAENLRAQGHLHGLSGSQLRDRMQQVMERLSLADRRDDLVETLSGGLKRRVEIAKGLLHRPVVLLMDEASTGLDPGARRELWQYVEELRSREGVTILLTTHILDEADRCDRLALLHRGQVVAEGTPAHLRSSIGGDVVVLQAVGSDASEPAELARRIETRFGVKPSLVDGVLRVEIANGHRFITEVVEAFPGAIDSVGLHKPTLEDVFVHETGALIE